MVLVTQNWVSGGARDRFFGGAGEGFLAILEGLTVFLVKFFGPVLRFFGRASDLSVGFRGGWSVFKFSGSELVF